MKRTWTKTGEKFIGTPIDDGLLYGRDAVVRAIKKLEWKALPQTMSMTEGFGIRAAIEQLKIPKPSHVASSHELAPYGFYGIRAHYPKGDAEIFLVDTGTEIVCVCSDFEPKGAVTANTL